MLVVGRSWVVSSYRGSGLKTFIRLEWSVRVGLCIIGMLRYAHYSDLNIILIFPLRKSYNCNNMSKNIPIVAKFNT